VFEVDTYVDDIHITPDAGPARRWNSEPANGEG
jgi:hypothetical protein